MKCPGCRHILNNKNDPTSLDLGGICIMCAAIPTYSPDPVVRLTQLTKAEANEHNMDYVTMILVEGADGRIDHKMLTSDQYAAHMWNLLHLRRHFPQRR